MPKPDKIKEILGRLFCTAVLFLNLGDQGTGVLGVVSPGGRENLGGLEVTRKTVDAGLNQTETVLGIQILAVGFQVLADSDGLLDQVVQVLRDGGGESCAFQVTTSSKDIEKEQ